MRQALGCGCGAAFAALFGAIYELFSHSVYSYSMIYAFAPLLALSLIYIFWGSFARVVPKRAARNLFTASAATAAVGLVANGVVYIFGSTNRLLAGYIFLTAATFTAALICYLHDRAASRHSVPQQ